MLGLFDPSLGTGLTPGAAGLGLQMPQPQNPAMGLGMGLTPPPGAMTPQFQQQQFNPQVLAQAMGLMQMGRPQMLPSTAPQPFIPQGHPMQLANLNQAQMLPYMRF